MSSMIISTFSETLPLSRDDMGRKVTEWLSAKKARVHQFDVTLSSDRSHHCLTLTCVGTVASRGEIVIAVDDVSKDDHTFQRFQRVKVFSATLRDNRSKLGDVVTEWCAENGATAETSHVIVRQSSDTEYHCLVYVVLY